jgi:hypothetical protein
MRDAEVVGSGVFEGGYRLAEDKLLRLQHMAEGIEQLAVQRGVLPLQVKHWNGHGNGLGF